VYSSLARRPLDAGREDPVVVEGERGRCDVAHRHPLHRARALAGGRAPRGRGRTRGRPTETTRMRGSRSGAPKAPSCSTCAASGARPSRARAGARRPPRGPRRPARNRLAERGRRGRGGCRARRAAR
jgi:hypothetical protein